MPAVHTSSRIVEYEMTQIVETIILELLQDFCWVSIFSRSASIQIHRRKATPRWLNGYHQMKRSKLNDGFFIIGKEIAMDIIWPGHNCGKYIYLKKTRLVWGPNCTLCTKELKWMFELSNTNAHLIVKENIWVHEERCIKFSFQLPLSVPEQLLAVKLATRIFLPSTKLPYKCSSL